MNMSPRSRIIGYFCATIFLSACQTTPKEVTTNPAPKDLQNLFEKQALFEVKNIDEALKKARSAWMEGKSSLAIAFYVKAFDLEPTNADILMELADAYQVLGKSDLEETCYTTILENDPNNMDALERYGLLLIKSKKYREAETALVRVVETNPQSWRAYNGLGILSDVKGKHIEAIEFYDIANTVDSNNPEILNNKGFSFYMNGNLDQAQHYYMQALKANPGFKKAIYNYALTKGRQGNYQEALSIFSRTLNAPEANNNTGYIALMNGDLERAEFYLTKAIQLSDHFYAKAHENMRELETRKLRSPSKLNNQ